VSLAIERIAIATHLGDARLERTTTPYHQLAADSPTLRALQGRAAVALNLGDPQKRDRAFEDAAVALRVRHPELVREMVTARELAATLIAAWLSTMTVAKGGR
jgi:hypothetical protein